MILEITFMHVCLYMGMGLVFVFLKHLIFDRNAFNSHLTGKVCHWINDEFTHNSILMIKTRRLHWHVIDLEWLLSHCHHLNLPRTVFSTQACAHSLWVFVENFYENTNWNPVWFTESFTQSFRGMYEQYHDNKTMTLPGGYHRRYLYKYIQEVHCWFNNSEPLVQLGRQ